MKLKRIQNCLRLLREAMHSRDDEIVFLYFIHLTAGFTDYLNIE